MQLDERYRDLCMQQLRLDRGEVAPHYFGVGIARLQIVQDVYDLAEAAGVGLYGLHDYVADEAASRLDHDAQPWDFIPPDWQRWADEYRQRWESMTQAQRRAETVRNMRLMFSAAQDVRRLFGVDV